MPQRQGHRKPDGAMRTPPRPGTCYNRLMRLLALTYGTEGDTRPLTALCHGLREAGHDVLLLADAGTLDSARTLGLPCAALAGDIRAEVTALVSKGNAVAAAAQGLARMARTHAQAWTLQAVEAARDRDAIIGGGLAAFIARSVAEHLDIPLIGAGMIPITPTRAFASPFLPAAWIPPALNRASQSLVNRMIWRQFRGPVNRARAALLGRPPLRFGWEGFPMLHGFSPSLVPRPADWPSNHVVCGQWRMPAPSWRPSGALQQFLAAGAPPVYIGFGSMSGFDREHVMAALLRMLDGRRALLWPGWAGLPALPLPSSVHVVDAAPHEVLFPLTSLVIHHGGSGTTHSACTAGVPSMVMPLAADQSFWARRLHDLGVAPAPLSSARLSSSALAAALAQATSVDMRARAAALGARMRGEDGVATAVAAMEAWLDSDPAAGQ